LAWSEADAGPLVCKRVLVQDSANRRMQLLDGRLNYWIMDAAHLMGKNSPGGVIRQASYGAEWIPNPGVPVDFF